MPLSGARSEKAQDSKPVMRDSGVVHGQEFTLERDRDSSYLCRSEQSQLMNDLARLQEAPY